MTGIIQDLRFSVRALRKNPSFTLVAVLALGLGIGANTAIFSIVNAVLIRPLPYPESHRLVRIWEKTSQLTKGRISFADYNDWKEQNQVFEEIAAYQTGDFNLMGADEPEQIQGASVSRELFSVLRVQPGWGRTFLPEEEKQNANPVATISYRLWARRFGSDPALIGKTIKVDNRAFTVVGIMPASFSFPNQQADLWLPLVINPKSRMAGRGMHILQVVGRLKAGVSLEQTSVEMDTIARRLAEQYPADNTGHGVSVLSLRDDKISDFRTSLLIIFWAVGFVLLIACANVANLLLARAAVRRKEMALRIALGASRGRVVRQLLTESILLAGLGGTLGLLIGIGGLRLLIFLNAGNVPRVEESTLDGSVLIFTLLLTLATGIVFGLVPALQISKPNLSELIKGGAGGGLTSWSGSRLRSLFVVIEVALSLMLLVGAGLLLKSLARIQNVSPGFNVENVLTAKINLPNSKYRGSQGAAFVAQVLERIRTQPQTVSAGAVTHLPLAGNGPNFDFEIAGRPAAAPGEEFKAQMRSATPDYFTSLGIPVLEGRQFTSQDSNGTPNVMIINEVMARRYWPKESAVGQQISLDKGEDGRPIWRQIVGVVKGVRHNGLEFEPEPQMYAPYYQFSMPFVTLVIRANSQPLDLTANVRRAVLEVDKEQPIAEIRTMEQIVSTSVAPRQFSVILLGVFSAVALLLASIGIYGVISYSVVQRTRELGIRMALGAQRGAVMKSVLVQGLSLALLGIAIGAVAALGLVRLLSGLLYQVSANDPYVFVGIAILLLAVALLASYLPARRAAAVDPLIALRYE